MRNMSFMLTTEQIIDETKTVTRRLGWWFLKPGDLVMACEKCQGLGKGGKINKLKPIRIIKTGKEYLVDITQEDVEREGFPELTTDEFIVMFRDEMKCKGNVFSIVVNRIEFEYID